MLPTISMCASSSVPMSVRIPATSRYGILNRWFRYRIDAASSPSGPPDTNVYKDIFSISNFIEKRNYGFLLIEVCQLAPKKAHSSFFLFSASLFVGGFTVITFNSFFAGLLFFSNRIISYTIKSVHCMEYRRCPITKNPSFYLILIPIQLSKHHIRRTVCRCVALNCSYSKRPNV